MTIIQNLSYREKVLWVNLITTVVFLGYYFLSVLTHDLSAEQAIWLYLKVVFWIVIIEVVVLTILASLSRPEKPDERDRTIEARAYKIGYIIAMAGLGIAIWQVSVNALAEKVQELPDSGEALANLVSVFTQTATPYITINIILVILAIAEIAKAGTQLYYYRRGV